MLVFIGLKPYFSLEFAYIFFQNTPRAALSLPPLGSLPPFSCVVPARVCYLSSQVPWAPFGPAARVARAGSATPAASAATGTNCNALPASPGTPEGEANRHRKPCPRLTAQPYKCPVDAMILPLPQRHRTRQAAVAGARDGPTAKLLKGLTRYRQPTGLAKIGICFPGQNIGMSRCFRPEIQFRCAGEKFVSRIYSRNTRTDQGIQGIRGR